ncbi:GntR family transcriptional regulator [Sphingobacterium athyrii]|uniref:GntR family transcriptional regulator n=1 Tax=Sphingobacterium athyrii TaxID=2152717 RepID=A0A363P1F0_9SPHI|nr:GntR family transcriptional regulator [Sphingobacterium athyrii]PUV26663.1 GntR family transcriptional regulator [Sphingobacterium athyrii]
MQLVEYVLSQIEQENLQINDRLPSLNQLTSKLEISKETALKGLQYLTEKGIIEAEFRKGYYVRRLNIDHTYRICLILDKMNILRDRFYQCFLESMGDQGEIDIFFHHHNYKVFSDIILGNLNNYTHFIVATFLKEDPSSVLNQIPAHKRIIIDYNEENLEGNYSVIYQDFEHDIYNSLTKLQKQVNKYKKLVLIAHSEASHAEQVIKGFVKYCEKKSILHEVQSEVTEEKFKKNTGYITFSRYDTDDVALIKLAKKQGCILGEDIGLISYNDTAVKEILEGGITVISTDFDRMGRSVADIILGKKSIQERNPTQVIIRNSF